ncbi:MAG: L-rhamnose isomerase [Eubacteriales bacterium]
MSSVESYYSFAKEKYKEIGIDTDAAIEKLKKLVFSLKCCDIVDIDSINETSDYKNEKENSPKLRNNLEKAFSLIPGKHRISLNAIHMDADEFVELDEIENCHYEKWVEWAKKHTSGMDFYTSMIRHEKSDKGFALSDRNKDIRYFWVEHCQRCRLVGQYIGTMLQTPCITTINVNDYFKSSPTDFISTQEILVDSLNKVYSEPINKIYNLDSVFTGLGDLKDDYVPIADETFCQNYATQNNLIANINTNSLKGKKKIYQSINAVIPFTDKIIINIRPEENSDNLIMLNDKTLNLARYIVHNDLLEKVIIYLDFKTEMYDLAKVKKWVIGTRAVQKAFLKAFLEPTDYLKECDEADDYNSKAALIEEFNSYPYGAVWDYYCKMMNVPVGFEWLDTGNHVSN